MFDTSILDDEEVVAEKEVSTTDPVLTAGEVVTTTGVEVCTVAITSQKSMDKFTLAKALIDIKTSKPKAKGIVMQEPKEEERLTRQKEEEANIALIAEWDNTQAMMDADYQMAQQLQTKEQEHFEEVQKAFDNTMSWINSFVPMEKDIAKGSEKRAEGSSKRAGEELKSDKSKKQKLNEQVEAKVDDDQEGAEMKMYMKIIPDDEIAIDAIPLATKPPIIVDWKIIKEGKMSSYHLIRANGSSKRYSSMIQMLQHIDREDLETLWNLVKAKYGNTRPEEGYERVL
uniref:Uncharacterized protein n=1 Tax=Tanacetum cinerariifolium TaxID=118510 RepID=A0A6L2JWW6_TANCI|nr:hypothetical protein [Tanacetum cinerariifolium]